MTQMTAQQAVAHLQPEVWAKVNRHLVAKAIAEFAHELLIAPCLRHMDGAFGHYQLRTDREDVEYRFRARRAALDHYCVDRESLHKLEAGRRAPLDALLFIVELRQTLAIPAHVLPEYLHELASTLYAAAFKHERAIPGAAELAHAPFQTIESAMSEGHPIFVANNARIGFSAEDYVRYAPEAGTPLQYVWLAASRQRADFACIEGLSPAQLLERELGAETCERFAATLRARGLDPADYVYLPVHPWQWENRVAQLFASDLASGALCELGRGPDHYLPQQSIRTCFNVSQPHRYYVKTALSILNMGFTRGLSSAGAQRGMAVNAWASALVDGDAYLQRCGFSLLREVAWGGFRHRHYEAAIDKRVEPYKEMLAALWRENPLCRLRPRQRVMTMAALLHVDRDGAALLPALIAGSRLGVEPWLRRYLNAYLKPLLHCFYAHNLVFTPHCENTLLVLEDDAVTGVFMKDLAEDIGVLNPEHELPASVHGLGLRVPEDTMTLAIFTDVFDCVFRLLAPLLRESTGLPEANFWRLVAECITGYQREQPQLGAKFRRYDLFAPTFLRNCLNRLQLRDNRLMVDLNAPEPVDSLQFVGTLDNPIAGLHDAGRASAQFEVFDGRA